MTDRPHTERAQIRESGSIPDIAGDRMARIAEAKSRLDSAFDRSARQIVRDEIATRSIRGRTIQKVGQIKKSIIRLAEFLGGGNV